MANFQDPWHKRHAWRTEHALFTRAARIKSMFPGFTWGATAFAVYLGYEYLTAPKAEAHHGSNHH